MANAVLEWINQFLENIVQNFNIYHTYVDETDPWTLILSAEAFVIFSTTNGKKGYSPGKLIFGRDIILPIEHNLDWGLIRQQKHMKTNKDTIRENKHIFYHKYKARNNFMITKHTAYNYETPYMGPFLITQCFINGTVKL